MSREVTVSVDGDEVVVFGEGIVADRSARLFFLGSLGAFATDVGWRCPARRRPIGKLVVRVNTFLESKGWTVRRLGVVDDEVERALERKRGYERTREAAEALSVGTSSIEIAQVHRILRAQGWDDQRRLRPHQEQGVLHALTAINAANFSVPGAGKTTTTLAVAAAHVASGTIDLVLVVGPLSCFAPWERETAAALGSALRTIRVRGPSSRRRDAYRAARSLDLLLVSYASAAADRPALVELCQSHRTMLVVDESHRVKRFSGGTWAPALIEIAKAARLRMILSGTPMPQSGKDLYSQLNILWPDGELTGPRDDFGVRVERDFDSLLRDIRPFMSRTPKHALGLAPYTVHRHDVPMVGLQAEVYELIEGYFRRRVAGADSWADKVESLRRGRPIRLLQAATNPDALNGPDANYRIPRMVVSGASLMDRLASYRGIEKPAKMIYAADLVEQFSRQGQKVVCWSNFIVNLDQFAELLRAAGIRCFQVDGRVAAGTEPVLEPGVEARGVDDELATREEVIEHFLDCEGPAALVANPASCSESISLHRSCRAAIYLDRTYDCALFLQSVDRIHRLGLPEGAQVEVHILNATIDGRATIDHLVDASLLQKEATMLQLLQGAELAAFSASDDPLVDAQGDERDLGALLRFLLGEGA